MSTRPQHRVRNGQKRCVCVCDCVSVHVCAMISLYVWEDMGILLQQQRLLRLHKSKPKWQRVKGEGQTGFWGSGPRTLKRLTTKRPLENGLRSLECERDYGAPVCVGRSCKSHLWWQLEIRQKPTPKAKNNQKTEATKRLPTRVKLGKFFHQGWLCVLSKGWNTTTTFSV